MTETILKALMRLFSIIANLSEEDKLSHARSIVESFLKQQVRHEKVNQYLIMFDFYCKSFKQKNNIESKKQIALYSVKVLVICERINEVLEQNQKILILLQLFEVISNKPEITSLEAEFVKTVSNTLKISDTEYYNTEAFINNSFSNVPDKDKVLIIDSNKSFDIPGIKHISKFSKMRMSKQRACS